ncbi:P-loop containing nucleoside triphosphate hydrolase protein [Lobosporangium transversale]|uniref:DNA 3'-5' helicase n=1 Tax=Lobosporangium transversale TaxID=64571 RepID=A0A1Y2G8F1_9FUNG|nr:P-loop containing nucleoside triphosphate hydrolase protein [Lobosporangium transversale]ORZ04209.1 P-loop containing nucleoside triphosphate hydrolase protein [Lobosporangium transversale]|eukprot:XP_021876423.1 P-loop containing nucleoside triphosphate hydrolase protein [Lobosporangium transversale]
MGGKFRKGYKKLGYLRSYVSPDTCFVAVSATLPPPLLLEVISVMRFKDVKEMNIGNDRKNVEYVVRRLKHAVTLFKDLHFLIDRKKTIVYFQTRDEADSAAIYLRNIIGPNKVALYHSNKSSDRKKELMEQFKSGDIDVLMSTEAVGMGCDISDVLRVVQYGYPDNISSLVQRLGRAVRNPELHGEGIVPISSRALGKVDKDIKAFVNTQCCRRAF